MQDWIYDVAFKMSNEYLPTHLTCSSKTPKNLEQCGQKTTSMDAASCIIFLRKSVQRNYGVELQRTIMSRQTSVEAKAAKLLNILFLHPWTSVSIMRLECNLYRSQLIYCEQILFKDKSISLELLIVCSSRTLGQNRWTHPREWWSDK